MEPTPHLRLSETFNSENIVFARENRNLPRHRCFA